MHLSPRRALFFCHHHHLQSPTKLRKTQERSEPLRVLFVKEKGMLFLLKCFAKRTSGRPVVFILESTFSCTILNCIIPVYFPRASNARADYLLRYRAGQGACLGPPFCCCRLSRSCVLPRSVYYFWFIFCSFPAFFVAAPAITFSPHSPVAGRSRGGRTTSNPDELTDRTQFARARGLVWTSLCLRHSKQSLAGSPLVHEQC